jgi:[protein-PII] uridylyltransferase
VLDRLQLPVVEARISNTRSGVAIDLFRVLDPKRDPSARSESETALRAQLMAELAKEPLQAKPVQRMTPRTHQSFPVPLRLEFHPAGGLTELALRCADRPGLLARIAQALRESGVRVHAARIATFGERAEDSFILSDVDNSALTTAAQTAVKSSLEKALG